MSLASPLQSPLTAEESLSINGVLGDEPRVVSSAMAVALGVSGDKPGEGEIKKASMEDEEQQDCATVTPATCCAATGVTTIATCSITSTSSTSSSSSSTTAVVVTSKPIPSAEVAEPIPSLQNNSNMSWNSGGAEADNYPGGQMPGAGSEEEVSQSVIDALLYTVSQSVYL